MQTRRTGGLRSAPGEWEQDGACKRVAVETMYPEDHSGDQKRARAVCSNCPVKDKCLEHALRVNEKWGTWGGLGEAPRQRLRRYLLSHPGSSVMDAIRATGTKWSPPLSQQAQAS